MYVISDVHWEVLPGFSPEPHEQVFGEDRIQFTK